MNKDYILKLIDKGVIIEDVNSTYIDESVEIEDGVTIKPNNYFVGDTKIKKGAIIYPNCFISNSVIMEEAVVRSSTIENSIIGKNTAVGVNAHLRPNSVIGENCKIGNFVEIKNSIIGNNTKVAHLTYIGDSVVGEKVNFGCGVVTANYDGKNKFKTIVEDNCFIGCNVNLIAPITVGKNSFIAAGVTASKDIPPNTKVYRKRS